MASQIQEFFSGQTIFITGGSGFMGKVLIEKLLRECDGIRKIYVLMRPKKNKTPEERFNELFNYACFDVLKSKNPDAIQKVCLINGDCQEPLLGLKESDIEILLEETTCVIHAAANVKFEQTLKEASYIVRATRDITELAKRMRSLKVFVYISTAFSNALNTNISEEFYEPPMKAEDLLKIVNAMDEETLKAITPALLGKWPNSYVYSKCISENVVKRAVEDLPVVVIRPAVILNTAIEPFPGWVDNLYSLIGVLIGGSLGAVRTMNAKLDAVAPLIPVDYLVNCTLAAAWHRATSGTTKIYNYVGHKNNLINSEELFHLCLEIRYDVTSVKVIWHSTLKPRENKIWNRICMFFLHTLVAYIVDGVLFCLGKPTIAVNAYGRLNKLLDLLSYFTVRHWNFSNENVTNLWNYMNDEDKKMFFFDMEKLNWQDYLYESALGVRKHIFKESIDTLPKARRKMKMFLIAHYTFLAVFWYLIYRFAIFMLGCFF